MKKILPTLILLLVALSSCTKEFLDEKPSISLLVPTTLGDMRALLDNVDEMNVLPGLNVISDDDFYRTPETFASLQAVAQNAYTWQKDLFSGGSSADWNRPYTEIFTANAVLEALAKAEGADSPEGQAIRGHALLLRGTCFYHLAQEFAPPFDPATADALPGIPVRLSADVNQTAGRGTLRETYEQVIKDLTAASLLLPAVQPYKNRPVRAAAFALLSRVYLSMQRYMETAAAAGAALALNAELIDYNTLSTTAARPFPVSIPSANPEVLFYAVLSNYSSYNSSASTLVDPLLYNSYAPDDLRKAAFFISRGGTTVGFKGNYTGGSAMFGGVATDEVYLNRAEAYARLNRTAEALTDLNTLLIKRWRTGRFTPLMAANADAALLLILTERRKELIGRGLRWADLRRLNPDSRLARTLTRQAGGNIFTLRPGSPNYTLPIPDGEIGTSGIAQNPRE